MEIFYNLAKEMVKDHEVYHLWYEYLKANKDFKKVCDIMLKFSNLPEDKQRSFFIDPINELGFERLQNLTFVFGTWGDVYKTSWEDKLVYIHIQMTQKKENEKIIPFSNLLTAIQYPNLFTLGIPIEADIDDLVRQFREMVSKKQEEAKVKPVKKAPPFPLPSRKLSESDIKNLRRYLEVYHLKEIEKLSWGEVIQKLDPKDKIHKSLDPKVWRRERDNARDVIENTSNNIFPGEYGQVRQRKKRTTKKRIGSPVYLK